MATIRVTNTNNGGSGSLRQAITQANITDGLDTIVFDESLSGETITINRELTIEESVLIDGDLNDDGIADITVAVRENATNTRVLNINDDDDDIDQDVTLEGLVITGGNVEGAGGGIYAKENLTLNSSTVTGNEAREVLAGTPPFTFQQGNDGGGIYIDGAQLTLNDSVVSNNIATYGGGGIFAEEASVVINNSIVSGNEGENNNGGGISVNTGTLEINSSELRGNESRYDGGAIFTDEASVTITQSTIANNIAGSDGGGIEVNTSTLTVFNSVISGNDGDGGGGGIYGDDSTIRIVDSEVNNNVTAGNGGGLHFDASSIEVLRSTVSDNIADSEGGGILSHGDAEIEIRDSLISNNAVNNDEGGGIYVQNGLIVNSTISGNSANGDDAEGGGIYHESDTLTLINVTVVDNRAALDGNGGGIYADGEQLTIINSIVSGNSASSGDGDDIYIDEGNVISFNSLFGDSSKTTEESIEVGTNATFQPSNGDIVATSDGDTPTRFSDIVGRLADNGGPTLTHSLPEGSPAIDTGRVGPSTTTLDQRGLARVVGGGVDIGAFEEQTSLTSITTPNTATVDENQAVAIDVNGSDDSAATFAIVGGDDANLFNIDADTGLITFATPPNFENPTDTGSDNVYELQVSLTNADGRTDTQDLAITVSDINDAPIALDDAGITTANQAVTVNLTINDFDEDRDPLSIDSVGTAANGRVQIDSANTITYIPNAGFSGLDSFDYTVTDGTSTDTGSVAISVGTGGTVQTPIVDGQFATIFVDNSNRVVGNAFEAGEFYTGAANSNTDGTTNPNDVIAGTFGDDNLYGGTQGSDTIAGFSGNDIIGYGAGDAVVLAGSGNDLVYAADPSTFSDSNNRIDLGSGADNFYAFIGNNTVTGSGDNIISVGNGNDTITTQAGDDFVYSLGGGGGNDVLQLGEGDNLVVAERGNYTITTGSGNDIIGLGSGNDVVRAGNGDNIIYRVDENAVGDGNKDVVTGTGDDFIATGSGSDRINAGTGLNTLFGGAGADTFVFRTGAYNFIGDFELNADRIDLEGGLSINSLSVFQGSNNTASDVFIFAGSEAIGQVANTTVAEFEAQALFVA